MLLKRQNEHWQITWQPARPVFIADNQHWTARDVLQLIAAACDYVDRQQGDNVLLVQRDSLLFAIWFIALCIRGKHVLLASDEQPETLQQLSAHVDWRVPDIFLQPDQSVEHENLVRLSEQAQVSFFTSGSSGKPKLIRKALVQLLLEVQTLEQQFGNQLSKDAIFCGTVSAQHIYGLLFRLLWPLCSGRPIHILQISYLEQWQAVMQHWPCVFIASPAHLARFDDIATLSPVAKQCQRIFSSGGPLPDDVPPRYVAVFGQAPTEVFGSTETGGVAFRQRNTNETPWQVFPGISISQADDSALQLHSPYLPDDQPYVTQDAVRLLGAGSFELLGRLDRIAKIEEKRLSLPEMEQFCLRSPLVEEAAAVLLQHKRVQLALVVVLTPVGQQILQQQGKLALSQQLKAHLLQRFERVMLPRKIRYVSALPYNVQGKLPYQQLEALFYA